MKYPSLVSFIVSQTLQQPKKPFRASLRRFKRLFHILCDVLKCRDWRLLTNYYFIYYSQENKTRDLSHRLELTQRELKSFKNQLNVRTVALWNSQNSTLAELDKLKAVWTEINTTVEKTFNFPDKVGYGYCEHIHLCDHSTFYTAFFT